MFDVKKLKKQTIARENFEKKIIADSSVVLDDIRNALKSGQEAFGLTMGRVSLIQIIEMIAKEFGGGFDFKTCVWSANQVDIARLADLKDNGHLNDCKFLIDPSAYTRKPEAVEMIYTKFGIDNVRSVATHAKFVTLTRGDLCINIVSSMNLTKNPRIEQYHVFNCKKTSGLLTGVINESFDKLRPEDNFTGQALYKFRDIKKKLERMESESAIDDEDFDLDAAFDDIKFELG